MSHRVRILATVAGATLVALVLAGCGRGVSSPSPVAGESAAAVASLAVDGSPSASPEETIAPVPTDEPAPTLGATQPAAPAPTPPPTSPPAPPAPFEAPDLTAIQRLLDELDAALGADATADTEEGSAP